MDKDFISYYLKQIIPPTDITQYIVQLLVKNSFKTLFFIDPECMLSFVQVHDTQVHKVLSDDRTLFILALTKENKLSVPNHLYNVNSIYKNFKILNYSFPLSHQLQTENPQIKIFMNNILKHNDQDSYEKDDMIFFVKKYYGKYIRVVYFKKYHSFTYQYISDDEEVNEMKGTCQTKQIRDEPMEI